MISPLLECVKGMDGLRSEWVNNSFFHSRLLSAKTGEVGVGGGGGGIRLNSYVPFRQDRTLTGHRSEQGSAVAAMSC